MAESHEPDLEPFREFLRMCSEIELVYLLHEARTTDDDDAWKAIAYEMRERMRRFADDAGN